MEDLNAYQVYAKTDGEYVTSIYSSCFQAYKEGDILIKEGNGDEFVHVNYYQVYDERMCHNYKIVNDEMVECTKEEKEKEFQDKKSTIKSQPTKLELLEQQVADLEIELLSLR